VTGEGLTGGVGTLAGVERVVGTAGVGATLGLGGFGAALAAYLAGVLSAGELAALTPTLGLDGVEGTGETGQLDSTRTVAIRGVVGITAVGRPFLLNIDDNPEQYLVTTYFTEFASKMSLQQGFTQTSTATAITRQASVERTAWEDAALPLLITTSSEVLAEG
jgi:hypothetical protein